MTRTRMCLATLAAAAGLALALPATASAAAPADVKVSVESRGNGFAMSACPLTATNVGGTTAYDVNVAGFSVTGTQFTIPELAPGESVTGIIDCGQGVPVFGFAAPSDWNVFNNFALSWSLFPS